MGVPLLGRHRPFSDEVAIVSPDPPHHARQTVRNRGDRDVRPAPLGNAARPRAEGRGLRRMQAVREGASCGVHQERAEIPVPLFADRPQVSTPPAGVFPRREPQIAGKVPARRKAPHITDARHQRRGIQQPDAGDGAELRDVGDLVRQRRQLVVEVPEALLERADLFAHRRQARAETPRDGGLRVFEHAIDLGHHMGAPTGIVTPNSRSSPRSVLRRAVRVRSHVVRMRWRDTTACCAGDFTGTAWMSSFRAASSNAFASARSVLFRRTYRRTSWGDNSRTVWPSRSIARPQWWAEPQASSSTVAVGRSAKNDKNRARLNRCSSSTRPGWCEMAT